MISHQHGDDANAGPGFSLLDMGSRLTVVVVTFAGWLALVITGVTPTVALAITGVVALQSTGGAIVWRVLRRHAGDATETVGMGLALGTAFAVLAGLSIKMVGLGDWGWGLPAFAALTAWAVSRLRTHGAPAARSLASRDGTLALVFATVLGFVSLIYNLRSYPLNWAGTWKAFHPDMLFFEATANSFAHLASNDSIFMAGSSLRYHWLTYAWAGQVSVAAGAGPFVVLTRVLPIVSILAGSCIVIGWSRRLSRVAWVPTLAVVLLIAAGYVGATYGTILNFDSPSQALTTIWLLSMCVVVTDRLNAVTSERIWATVSWLSVLAILGFAMTAGKVSTGAMAVAATSSVAIVALLRWDPIWRASVGAATATSAGAVLGYFFIVAGSADPGGLHIGSLLDRASSVQGLNPIYTRLGIAVGTAVFALAVAIRWAGLAWLISDPSTRYRSDTLMGMGLVVASLTTVLLLSGGLNDTWFALAASGPLIALSAAGVGEAARAVKATDGSWRPSRPLVLAVVAGVVLAAGVTALWAQGASGGNVWVSTPRWLGPPIALAGAILLGLAIAATGRLSGPLWRRWLAITVIILVITAAPARLLSIASAAFGVLPGTSDNLFTPREPFVESLDRTTVSEITAAQLAAASWLRSHANPKDLIATNVTFSPLVPALTGLPMYVSAIQYQAPYGRTDALQTLLEREQQSLSFIATPSLGAREDLCTAGVRWLWVDTARTQRPNWRLAGSLAYEGPGVDLVALDCKDTS